MQLLTAEIRQQRPPLYSNESLGQSAKAVLKFFDPSGGWEWYATEGSLVCPEHQSYDCTECPKDRWTDFLFFGLVIGHEQELGYFSLSELQNYRGPFGLGIERDRSWTPRTLRELMDQSTTTSWEANS